MDAIVAIGNTHPIRFLCLLNLLALTVCLSLAGCAGKTLVDDNPVFADAPPRGSYDNKASLATSGEKNAAANISTVSLSKTGDVELTGNTVIAEVNGNPIFVDDLVGSMRLTLDENKQIPADERQKILKAQIRAKLDNYVEQEIVIDALNTAIPADRQEAIAESLEEPFQGVLTKIKSERKIETDAELNEVLGAEGLSIDLLRESFMRIQKVQGYLSTLAETPRKIERPEIVEYYQTHKDEFTTDERVRWQELVIRFDRHGGQESAQKVMADVVGKLQSGGDFAELATQHSDSLSAEKRGDMGWLQRGSLADKTLESRLFELKSGDLTKVFVRNDRFEVYRVVDHQMPRTAPLQEVQNDIEQKIIQQMQRGGREELLADLRSKATVVSIFDDEK